MAIQYMYPYTIYRYTMNVTMVHAYIKEVTNVFDNFEEKKIVNNFITVQYMFYFTSSFSVLLYKHDFLFKH